jgi:hypothetical protein
MPSKPIYDNDSSHREIERNHGTDQEIKGWNQAINFSIAQHLVWSWLEINGDNISSSFLVQTLHMEAEPRYKKG